jgi:uncharacterized membrane protein YgcG
MKPVCKASLAVAVLALGAVPALAQPVISAKSGVVSYVQGTVMVGDEVVKPSETKFTEVKENAILRTEEGLAEVLLTSGTILRTGEHASFKMLTNRLIDTRLQLLTGSHVVEVMEVQKDNNLTLVMKDATVVITKHGLYRFDVDQSRIKVFDGVLGVSVNGQSNLVGAGKMIDATTASVEKFDKEDTDALDHWAQRRAELVARANASSAKQQHDYGCIPTSNFAAVNNGTYNPCTDPCGSWRYNPWFGVYTHVPCGGNIYSPYGYPYYSPYNVIRAFYAPPPPVYNRGGYSGTPQTSSGYSGAMSTSTSSVSSATSAAPSSTSSSSSVGSGGSSGGHGSAGGHH